jgi:hypothetical protein
MSNWEPLATDPAVPLTSVQMGVHPGEAPMEEPQLAIRKVALMLSPESEGAVVVGTLFEGRA